MSEDEQGKQRPHSAEYFNEMREFWWNLDFLRLMAERLEFANVGSVLDVGCGVGHWGRALAQVLPASARLTGVDREDEWVRGATLRAERAGLAARSEFLKGDATALPFADGTFDLVTCQTVLIHLPDARVGLREMMRVTKSGGLVLAVEPCNMASMGVFSSVTDSFPTERVAETLRFHLTCQRGKRALGLGFNSVGDLVPGMMAELGARDIRVYMSDRATPMYPPYDKPHQLAEMAQLKDWYAREFWVWDKAETSRYYLAGSGNGRSSRGYGSRRGGRWARKSPRWMRGPTTAETRASRTSYQGERSSGEDLVCQSRECHLRAAETDGAVFRDAPS